jgi:hypothetical protein
MSLVDLSKEDTTANYQYVPNLDTEIAVDQQTEALMGYCLENLRRVVYEGFVDEADENTFPLFLYSGQISWNEEKVEPSCFVVILKEKCLLEGLIIEFKNCAEIEVDMVLDQIYDIAYEIIDFSVMIGKSDLYSIVNPDYTGEGH